MKSFDPKDPVRVGAFEVNYVGFLKAWQVRGPKNQFVIQFAAKRNARHHALEFAFAADKGYSLGTLQ